MNRAKKAEDDLLTQPLCAVRRDRSWLAWKLHRFFLKHPFGWRTLRLGEDIQWRVKYLAEGKCNYIFRVRGAHRLLRISKPQFYAPGIPVGEHLARQNCMIMNSLAARGLSVPCEHIYGGALLVEDAGKPLHHFRFDDWRFLDNLFAGIEAWSCEYRKVILDYNEGNWCWYGGVVRLVDVDVNFICALDEVGHHPLVKRRVNIEAGMDDRQILAAFLRVELCLLREYLENMRQ